MGTWDGESIPATMQFVVLELKVGLPDAVYRRRNVSFAPGSTSRGNTWLIVGQARSTTLCHDPARSGDGTSTSNQPELKAHTRDEGGGGGKGG